MFLRYFCWVGKVQLKFKWLLLKTCAFPINIREARSLFKLDRKHIFCDILIQCFVFIGILQPSFGIWNTLRIGKVRDENIFVKFYLDLTCSADATYPGWFIHGYWMLRIFWLILFICHWYFLRWTFELNFHLKGRRYVFKILEFEVYALQYWCIRNFFLGYNLRQIVVQEERWIKLHL